MYTYCLFCETGRCDHVAKSIMRKISCRALYPKQVQHTWSKGKMVDIIHDLLPGYVFWETDNLSRIQDIKKEEGFIGFLPNDNGIKPLSAKDTELVTSFLQYGRVIPILNVEFDVNDRIVIVDGMFKGMEGYISDVNRSNKRINFAVTLMDGKRILSLSYREVQKK